MPRISQLTTEQPGSTSDIPLNVGSTTRRANVGQVVGAIFTSQGQIPYAASSGNSTFLNPPSSNAILSYSSASSAPTWIIGSSGQLFTVSSAGVTTVLAAPTSGAVLTYSTANTSVGPKWEIPTSGATLIASSISVPTWRAIGSSGQIFQTTGGSPAWVNTTAVLAETLGTAGDMLIRSTAGIVALAGPSSGAVLTFSTVDGTSRPLWSIPTSGSILIGSSIGAPAWSTVINTSPNTSKVGIGQIADADVVRLHIDATATSDASVMMLTMDSRASEIAATDFVGLHIVAGNSAGSTRVWGENIVIVKDTSAANSFVVGSEVSMSNNRTSAAQPLSSGSIMGYLASYIFSGNRGSAAYAVGGTFASWNNGIWIDGIEATSGRAIVLDDEVGGAGTGMAIGLDMALVGTFGTAAIRLGNADTISFLEGTGTTNINAISFSSGELVLNDGGRGSLNTRIEGTSANVFFLASTNNRIGMGTTAPDGRLHIFEGSAGTVAANAVADNLVIEDSSDAGLQFLCSSLRVEYILFGDQDNNAAGRILYDHSAAALSLWSEGVQRVQIGQGTSGGVTIGAPTGGVGAAGTLNTAGDIFKNSSAYTNPDYVLEHWATGKIERYINSKGAKEYVPLTLSEIEDKILKDYRLPGISTSPAGAFERSDIALAWIERLVTINIEQDKRIKSLEAKYASKCISN